MVATTGRISAVGEWAKQGLGLHGCRILFAAHGFGFVGVIVLRRGCLVVEAICGLQPRHRMQYRNLAGLGGLRGRKKSVVSRTGFAVTHMAGARLPQHHIDLVVPHNGLAHTGCPGHRHFLQHDPDMELLPQHLQT